MSRFKTGASRALSASFWLLIAVSLAGCSGADFADLKAFINEVKSRPGGRPEKMPEFKTYETYAYQVSDQRDPFSTIVDRDEILTATTAGSGPRPDVTRRKQALEFFPLDTLKYVGSIEREGTTWAIVTAPDGIVHRVQEGNYMGQNHGKVVTVSEARIEVVEIVPDGMGGWIERKAALSISE